MRILVGYGDPGYGDQDQGRIGLEFERRFDVNASGVCYRETERNVIGGVRHRF